MNYDEIRAMSEEYAARNAIETMEIKGYTVYFIDFEGYFGYSYQVYKNGHQIIADEACCHGHMLKTVGISGLRRYYIDKICKTLYTEDEIYGPIKNYEDYCLKKFYIVNYYHQAYDNISMCHICDNGEKDKAYKKSIKGKIKNYIGMCYMDEEYQYVIDRQRELLKELEGQKEKLKDNYEFQKASFLKEMRDHEYHINPQGDRDVLSQFGSVSYRREESNLDSYFDELQFTDIQRKAYLDARQDFLKQCS